jgi:hypothetical protein
MEEALRELEKLAQRRQPPRPQIRESDEPAPARRASGAPRRTALFLCIYGPLVRRHASGRRGGAAKGLVCSASSPAGREGLAGRRATEEVEVEDVDGVGDRAGEDAIGVGVASGDAGWFRPPRKLKFSMKTASVTTPPTPPSPLQSPRMKGLLPSGGEFTSTPRATEPCLPARSVTVKRTT